MLLRRADGYFLVPQHCDFGMLSKNPEGRRATFHFKCHPHPVADRIRQSIGGRAVVAIAEAMRRILVDIARRKGALKRGRGHTPRYFTEAALTSSRPSDEVIDVNDALDAFHDEDAVAAKLVKLHYFGGLSVQEPGVQHRLSQDSRNHGTKHQHRAVVAEPISTTTV